MKAEDLFKGTGCKQCGIIKTANARRINANIINATLEQMGKDIIMIGECSGVGTKTSFQCHFGHIWSARPIDILDGVGCPYCSSKCVWVGFNDLWTTRSDVAEMLLNPNDGYKYTYGSHAKVEFVCKNCKSIIKKTIKEVCMHGLSCSSCSDNISYPNKFSRSLLSQLYVSNVQYEYTPDWLRPYFYDNYFEYLGHIY